MSVIIWQKCLEILQKEYSYKQFNTYLRPLKSEIQGNELVLLAPKKYIFDKVNKKFFFRIKELVEQFGGETVSSVRVEKETTHLKDLDPSNQIGTFFGELIDRIINCIHH